MGSEGGQSAPLPEVQVASASTEVNSERSHFFNLTSQFSGGQFYEIYRSDRKRPEMALFLSGHACGLMLRKSTLIQSVNIDGFSAARYYFYKR